MRISCVQAALFCLVGLLAACGTAPPAPTERPAASAMSSGPATALPRDARALVHFETSDFTQLPGWPGDTPKSALPALLRSCTNLEHQAPWVPFCSALRLAGDASDTAIRQTIETFLVPLRVVNATGDDTGLVTGYYEPLLRGSRTPVAPYLTPLYGVPRDLIDVNLSAVAPQTAGLGLRGRVVGQTLLPYPARAELEATHALKGDELLWVDDPVDAFFLQIQGSGSVQLHAGDRVTGTVRLAYANHNGQPYRSIGRWLIDQQELGASEASMQGIRAWLVRHPERSTELFDVNPRMVFFREEALTEPSEGPRGALGVPLTAGRSIAVDPQVVPLGTPVYLATTEANSSLPLQRLVAAQDTGAAITTAPEHAVRVDLFFGSGDAAGQAAGRMKQSGQMWLLWPRTAALP